MMRLMTIAAALLLTAAAWAQTPVVTMPLAVNTSNASSTIAVTNTFQQVWAADTNTRGRSSCTVQNNSASNAMYVFFGAIASATTSNSVKLAAGQAVTCSVNGVILKDQVSITGTSGDAFYAAQQ